MRGSIGLALALVTGCFGQDTRVILLGTGTPNPEPERMGPAVAVVSSGRVYLVDCGAGVVRRAAQAGLKMEQLTRLFVTHLHSDHTVGYPDVIFTPAVTGRMEGLQVFGPPGLRAMTGHVMKAWREDMEIRLRGLEPSVAAAYKVTAKEVRPGVVYEDGVVRVRAIAVSHGGWRNAYAYRFEAKDKTVVISGDTAYSERLAEAARGADILVHEVYSRKGWEGRPAEWQRYHAAYHTSGVELGRLAAVARPKVLVLYHQLPMGQAVEEVLGEVRAGWGGEVRWGRDLDVIR
jgi:ribonuclease BN (tRNA processing enzyme)